MTDGTASLPFYASDNPPDIHHPAFDFTIVAYVQAPMMIHRVTDPPETTTQRKANDEAYRRTVAPSVWNRFTTLGYQATSGKDFDDNWRNRYSDPLRFHRLVWYNYMCYVDRGFDINEKLHFWATNVAHPFLIEHSPESLDMDTERFSWPFLITHLEKHADKSLWKQVGKNNRSPRRKSPPPVPPQAFGTPHELREQLPGNGTCFNLPSTSEASENNAKEHYEMQHETAAMATNSEVTKEADAKSSSDSDAKQSGTTMMNDVITNDGTHRVTFKWKLSKSEFTQLTQNHNHCLSEILSILGVLFSAPDGQFYTWDNEDLINARGIQDLSVTDIQEYLAPDILTIQSKNTIVFTIRFGFTDNPVAWKNADEVRDILKLNNIQVRVSNAKSTDGKLTIAGYILL